LLTNLVIGFVISPGFGCQTALLKIVEDWKRALDDN
jgi:hypothetical protein